MNGTVFSVAFMRVHWGTTGFALEGLRDAERVCTRETQRDEPTTPVKNSFLDTGDPELSRRVGVIASAFHQNRALYMLLGHCATGPGIEPYTCPDAEMKGFVQPSLV